MSIKVKLNDNPAGTDYYTNLDMIEGTVELDLRGPESFTSVTVKVEGVTKSTCYTDPHHGKSRSRTPVVEQHKVLFLADIVFPTPQLRQHTSASEFTLPAGRHSWPFRFQIPINNDCNQAPNALAVTAGRSKLASMLNEGRMAVNERIGQPLERTSHVQQILPPSMQGNDDVWIRYFVKATAKRSSRLAFNHRGFQPFIFLPIEKPLAEPGTGNAFFVRRQHTLAHLPDSRQKSGGLFRSLKEKRLEAGDTIALEIRMPNPPAVVPGVPVPMELYAFRETNKHPNSHLKVISLDCYLLVTTKLRAGTLKRNIGGKLPCYRTSIDRLVGPLQANRPDMPCLGIRFIETPNPFVVASEIAPTFATCNIARVYELQINVLIENDGKQEMVPLVMPLEVRSGVEAPPPLEVVPQSPGAMNAFPKAGDPQAPPLPSRDEKRSSGPGDLPGSNPIGAAVVDDLPTYNQATRIGGTSTTNAVGMGGVAGIGGSSGEGSSGLAGPSSSAAGTSSSQPLSQSALIQQQQQRPLTANLTLRRANRNGRTSYRVGDNYMTETDRWHDEV
ncbi:hypothetical protein PYCC9005_000376 [Savitreella phatthalungensis]